MRRKFCPGGHEGAVVPVGGELRSQRVELFGRCEAFVFGLDHQLFLLYRMHGVGLNAGVLGSSPSTPSGARDGGGSLKPFVSDYQWCLRVVT